MNQESDITPYSNTQGASNSATNSKSARIRKVGNTLKWGGVAGFWIQLVFGVVSTVTLLLAITSKVERNSPGTGFSLFCAVCGLICLIVGICISFRHGKTAEKFMSPRTTPPKKSTTIKVVQIGLITSLVGTFFTILGAEAIAGLALSKILAFGQGEVLAGKDKEFVNPLDLFIVQANINIIAAHFAGMLSSLWILNRIDR